MNIREHAMNQGSEIGGVLTADQAVRRAQRERARIGKPASRDEQAAWLAANAVDCPSLKARITQAACLANQRKPTAAELFGPGMNGQRPIQCENCEHGKEMEMLQGFVDYSPSAGKCFSPKVSIQRSGVANFNEAAAQMYGLATARHVRLMWNSKDRLIAIKVTDTNDKRAVSIKCSEKHNAGTDKGTRRFSISGFLGKFNIKPKDGYPVALSHGWLNDDPKTGIIVLKGM